MSTTLLPLKDTSLLGDASLFDDAFTPWSGLETGRPGTASVAAGTALHPRITTPLHPGITAPGLSDHEREVLSEWGWTYEIKDWQGPGTDAPREIVSCRVCGHDSFHPEDLANLYCSFCNAFHEDRERLWAAETGAPTTCNRASGAGEERNTDDLEETKR